MLHTLYHNWYLLKKKKKKKKIPGDCWKTAVSMAGLAGDDLPDWAVLGGRIG